MSTAEVEATLMAHAAVAEAAAVSRPHKVKGECLYCFVTLKNNREFSQTLAEELRNLGKAWMWGINQLKVMENGLNVVVDSFLLYLAVVIIFHSCYTLGRRIKMPHSVFLVREKIGPIATPDFIQNAPGLPKTRSGNTDTARFQPNKHFFCMVAAAPTFSSCCP